MLAIIGCGNSNRSDDGVGVFVAQALLQRLRSIPRDDVRVFDAGTGGMDVMFQARGASRLVIVDASQSGSPPGAIFEVPGSELQRDHSPSFSLHDFRWDHAVHAGRRIFGDAFPSELTVYLIEAGSLGFGTELTAPVTVPTTAPVTVSTAPPTAPVTVSTAPLNRPRTPGSSSRCTGPGIDPASAALASSRSPPHVEHPQDPPHDRCNSEACPGVAAVLCSRRWTALLPADFCSSRSAACGCAKPSRSSSGTDLPTLRP